MADRENGARSGVGSVVSALEESGRSEGSEFGVGERRFLGGLEAVGRDSGRGVGRELQSRSSWELESYGRWTERRRGRGSVGARGARW